MGEEGAGKRGGSWKSGVVLCPSPKKTLLRDYVTDYNIYLGTMDRRGGQSQNEGKVLGIGEEEEVRA
jgi:hypothetical protein